MDKHIKGLDGLRGISALLVAAMHFGLLSVGWIGVQIFYVISGLLITRILLNSNRTAFRPYIKRFYRHRVFRIAPLYYFYLVIAFALSFTTFGYALDRGRMVPLISFLYNIVRVLHPNTLPGLTVHLWSLSVEEQFYIMWPLALFLLPTRWLKPFVLAVIIAAPTLRLLLRFSPAYRTYGAYFLTPMQMGFALGAGLNLITQEQMRRYRRPAALLVLVLILVQSYVNRSFEAYGWAWLPAQHGVWIWGYTLLDLGAALLIVECLLNSRAIYALEWRPLRFLGQISYSFYVWHVAVLVAVMYFMRTLHLSTPVLFAVYVSAVVLVSSMSYYWIEMPFLRMKR